jgi:phosphoglycolate phosphatase-like HAD superfamily hydrolase
MQSTAVFWIRDGVLVDRMHVNPVAFAVAALAYADPGIVEQTNITALVNFAFETSGISFAAKMNRFNHEHMPLVNDVAGAAAYYNNLAGEAAVHCHYFNGACALVRHLKEAGVYNFITSAVEQPVLDVWAHSRQGKKLAPHLTKVLGKRPNFEKGEQHFNHAREKYGVEKIYYVADAVAEIENGAKFSNQLNITTVGFAHVITAEKVRLAWKLVMDAQAKLGASTGPQGLKPVLVDEKQLALTEHLLSLPDEGALTAMLKMANASSVVGGNADEIIGNLTNYFQTAGILP